MNADGWAYWQGAKSIADGIGYRYFSGDQIVAWPPLYSLYLSVWIKLLGSEAFVLVLANGVLIFLQGVGWTLLCYSFVNDLRLPGVLKYLAVYIALTLALYEGDVLAHNLFYTILPIFIGASWMTIRHEGKSRAYVALTCALGVALAESHFSGVLYVAAAALILVLGGKDPLQNRAISALAILFAPVFVLTLTAWRLGQFGSHPIEGGRFSFVQNLSQVSKAIGSFVVPQSGQILGWLCVLLIFGILGAYAFKRRATKLHFLVAFTGLALALLGVAFSITWLNGLISEPRHLMIIPLLLIPILISHLFCSDAVLARTAALLIFMTPVWRTLAPDDSIAAANLIPLHACISPIPGSGKTATVNGKMLVGPIRWEEPQGGYSSTGAPKWGASQARVVGAPRVEGATLSALHRRD